MLKPFSFTFCLQNLHLAHDKSLKVSSLIFHSPLIPSWRIYDLFFEWLIGKLPCFVNLNKRRAALISCLTQLLLLSLLKDLKCYSKAYNNREGSNFCTKDNLLWKGQGSWKPGWHTAFTWLLSRNKPKECAILKLMLHFCVCKINGVLQSQIGQMLPASDTYSDKSERICRNLEW